MFILETYSDPWNYTFIIVALIAIGIGTFLAIRNMNRDLLKKRREQRSKETPDIQSNNIKYEENNNINTEDKDTSIETNKINTDIVFHEEPNKTESISLTDNNDNGIASESNNISLDIDIDDAIEPLKKINTKNIETHEEPKQTEIINNNPKNQNNKKKYYKYYKNNKYYKHNKNNNR